MVVCVRETNAGVSDDKALDRAGLAVVKVPLAFGDDPDFVPTGAGVGLFNSLKRVYHCFEHGQQRLCLGKIGVADAASDTCFHSVLSASVRRMVGCQPNRKSRTKEEHSGWRMSTRRPALF